MSWKDELQSGAFRGVEFHVDVNELSGGRRTVVHEYPKRDLPFVEDMGRAARTITFDAYVIGADYIDAKNALIDALEKGGSGELVHPFYGRRIVQATDFSVRETRDEGGMARFSLSFIESEEATQPSSATDTAAAVEQAASTALDTAEAEFLDKFSVDGLPQWGVDKAAAALSTISDAMESAFAPIKASIENAAALNQQIVRLQDQAEDLVRMPEDLSNLMRSIMGSVAATDTPASDRSKVFSDFYDSLYLEPESVSTTTRQAVEDNRAALDDYAHQLAVINDASVSTSRVFDTLDDAETARDAIADRLDDQAETAPDDLYDDLMALRSSLVQAIPPEGATLPDLVTIKEQATLPAVVLAYRLYADATRDEEIVTRNRVRHPSFVPGGVDLEVLTSG